MIEAEHLTRHYGRTRAVDDLTFALRPGVVTGFLGPNGAGKSTTMRMIVGLETPTSGRVTVAGRPYRSLRAPMRTIGALLDAKAVHPDRSGLHHLLALARTHGMGRREVARALSLVGLDAVATHRAGTFSLGMGQRLGLAGALLGDPPVLVLDEPVNGLDPDGILWIRTLIRTLAGEGRTVLVSSHLMNEMAVTADHLIVLGRGRLLVDAPMADFIATATTSTVLLTSPDVATVAQEVRARGATVTARDDSTVEIAGLAAAAVGDIAHRLGARLHALETRRGSLEAAFMSLTHDDVEYRGGAS